MREVLVMECLAVAFCIIAFVFGVKAFASCMYRG